MVLCKASSPDTLDLSPQCVALWSTVLAALPLLFLLLLAVPKPAVLRSLTTPFLSHDQAEALDANAPPADFAKPRPPLRRTLLLAGISLAQTLAWFFVGSFYLLSAPAIYTARAYVTAIAWLYAVGRLVLRPPLTAPLDVFAIVIAHFAAAMLWIGGIAYERYVGVEPSARMVAGDALNLVAVLLALVLLLSMPTGVPTSSIDKAQIGRAISPEDFATLWEWCTFSWVYPLIKRGKNATLNDGDVWNLSPTLRARPVHIKFARLHRKLLAKQLWDANSLDVIIDFVGTYISVLFNYAGPYFLRLILDAIADPTPEKRAQAYIFTLLAFVCRLVKAEADLQHLWYGRRAGTRIQTELMAAIYDKALKRKDYSGIVNQKTNDDAQEEETDEPKAGADTGKIVNLMAGDVSGMSMFTTYAYNLYGVPFEIVLGTVFLYQLLGWSAFAGLAVIAVVWPLQKFIAARRVRILKGLLAASDRRMDALNELIGAVKLIKFFGWEENWIGRAEKVRADELHWLARMRIQTVMYNALLALVPVLISTVSFAVFVALGNELTVSTAFTAIALFDMIRSPITTFPNGIMNMQLTRVSLDRLSTFFAEHEVDGQVSCLKPVTAQAAEIHDVFGIEGGSFKWNEVEKDAGKDEDQGAHAAASSEDTVAERASDPAARRFELRDISVCFPEGKLTLVTGPTASGKSALLLALLGEMTRVDGALLMHKDPSRVSPDGLSHTISYAAQAPWLQHRSIRANILFGAPLDQARYDAVLDACALRPDLAVFEDGDETEIGVRGVSLSGGQKARVALARAVYARSQYVLLDDPLSAVDSHTARTLFDKLLMGPLLRGRTVVLVTHHVELVLPGAQYLVRMLDGRIDTQGSVADLRVQGVLAAIASEESNELAKEDQSAVPEEKSLEEVAVDGDEVPKKDADANKKPRKLVKDEERPAGAVKWEIYKTYLAASSYWTWAILVFFVACAQGLGLVEKLWIKIWGDAYGSADIAISAVSSLLLEQHSTGYSLASAAHFSNNSAVQNTTPTLPDARVHPMFYVGVFALIGLANVFGRITSIMIQYTGALRASRILFSQMLRTVMRATMRWHDTTPSGRILNRFGDNIETIDSSLAGSLQDVNTSMASFLTSILVIAYFFPVFLIPAAFLSSIYYYLSVGYLNTGRDLRRMQSNTNSPIYSGLTEMLEGIVTVRAFSAEKRFLDDMYVRIDNSVKMGYTSWMTNRWLSFNFDVLGALIIAITTLLSLSGYVSAGTAGICITSAMAFTNSVYWTCRFWTGLELDLNSVERVVEYLDLPQEPPAIIEDNRPPASWPARDSANMLVVDGLTVRYAPELPAVLRDVSFALRGGERVGLLGRTGSGKSTLAMSILRFVDPSEGRIIIDGIDITSIGLHDLRSNVTFIPQDATLFSGTLRENLDPLKEHDDSECLNVLYRVHMLTEASGDTQKVSDQGSHVSSRPALTAASSSLVDQAAEASLASATDIDSGAPITLDTQVASGGTNFSQGQRQLIALARALLRRSAVVVLDEATSSIDFETDAKIQAAIRTEFDGALLLTVAHRLRTVIDYDRLLVLDNGVVAEFDTPYNLIAKEDGIFRGMCLKSGSFGELEQIAKEKAGL